MIARHMLRFLSLSLVSGAFFLSGSKARKELPQRTQSVSTSGSNENGSEKMKLKRYNGVNAIKVNAIRDPIMVPDPSQLMPSQSFPYGMSPRGSSRQHLEIRGNSPLYNLFETYFHQGLDDDVSPRLCLDATSCPPSFFTPP